MKEITSEEFDKLKLHGRGSSGPLYNRLLKMNVGEGLIIYKTEWQPRYPPTAILNRLEKKFGLRFERGALADRSGWAVKRVK